MKPTDLTYVREIYGSRLQENSFLSTYTSARIGGPADALIITRSSGDLAEITSRMWEKDIDFIIIGGGTNLLVSDKGVRELLLINRARGVHFTEGSNFPRVKAESGASLNDLVQKAAIHGLSGLEWAASVPGSLGGAVYGNAGAFGGEMAASLVSIEINDRRSGHLTWLVDEMEYGYRTSILKKKHLPVIILSAELALTKSSPEIVRHKIELNSANRRSSQPSGASMGSIFMNPPGDYAGRLIENSGLKGKRLGNAEISDLHANFIVNHGQTRASDVKALIDIVRMEVEKKFGVALELEIELLGEW